MSDRPSIANPAMVVALLCDPAATAELLKHPALKKPRARRPRPKPVRQTWHDTADLLLASRDLALSDTAEGWHLDRLGFGWPRRPGTAAGSIGTSVHPAGLEERLGETIPGPLRPFGRLDGEILRFRLTEDGAVLNCALTTGEVSAIDGHGEEGKRRTIVRLEISGPVAAALALAERLAADLPVLPAIATLPQEILALGGAKFKAPPAPALTAQMQTEEALAILASGFVSTFLTRLGQIEGRAGPEPVHQARVTLRRLRALMLAFRPILRDREEALKPLLARLKEVLGPARDWDVFLSDTVESLARSLPDADPAAGWLRAAATARREAAYATLIGWLRQPIYRALAWQLVGLCLGEGWIATTTEVPAPPDSQENGEALPAPAHGDRNEIDVFATRSIAGRWKKTVRPTRELIPLPVAELHELRIKCKKIRYQAEMFQDALPGKSMRRLIKRLAAIQEVMGLLNDGVVATELALSLRPGEGAPLRDQVLAAEAIGLIHGYGIGRARDSREAIIAAWRDLRKSYPF